MAEYIDREGLLKHLEQTTPDNDWLVSQFNADWIYSFIESPLAADVVPREEVERLQKRIEILEALCKTNDRVGEDLIKARNDITRIKADTAREIFEEIEKYILANCCLTDDDVDGIWKHIAELKKKYTEDGK